MLLLLLLGRAAISVAIRATIIVASYVTIIAMGDILAVAFAIPVLIP